MKLDSCVFSTGTRIVVSPMIKNSTCPPFSLGFVAYSNTQFKHSPNIVVLDVSMVRKGKRGKQRIEKYILATQIFDIEMERKKIRQSEFRGYPFVHILNTHSTHPNVLDISPLEFLGWGMAHYIYIANLYTGEVAANRSWPSNADHPINLISNVDNRFYDHPIDTLQRYTNKEFRTEFVHELRKMEASVIGSALSYKLRSCFIELQAAAYLIYDNLKEKNELYDKTLITENYDYYREEYVRLCRFISKIEKSRFKLFNPKLIHAINCPDIVMAHHLNGRLEKWVGDHPPNFQTIIMDTTEKVAPPKRMWELI